ncbi:MAG: hypothetical protein WA446_10645 [Steroidobacteraceae bacterium]
MNRKNPAATKNALERAIFERFAPDADLVVRADSISQPDPPDILCEIEGLGRVAFELVQLDDAQELARMGYLHRAGEFWSAATESLTAEVLERHRGAQINISFHTGADQKQRRAALQLTAAKLSTLQEGSEGALFDKLPAGVEWAEVRHFPICDGPLIFEVSGFAVTAHEAGPAPSGISLGRIDDKITYYDEGWGVRAELLAYARWGMPFSDQMHDAGRYLATRLPAGIFARAWIYEVNSHEIVARAP